MYRRIFSVSTYILSYVQYLLLLLLMSACDVANTTPSADLNNSDHDTSYQASISKLKNASFDTDGNLIQRIYAASNVVSHANIQTLTDLAVYRYDQNAQKVASITAMQGYIDKLAKIILNKSSSFYKINAQQNQDLHIYADTLYLDAHQAVYEKNVSIEYLDLDFKSDKTSFSIENNRFTKIKSIGNPVTVANPLDQITAQADKIILHTDKNYVELFDNVNFNSPEKNIVGEYVRYSLSTKKIEINKSKDEQQKPTISIQNF